MYLSFDLFKSMSVTWFSLVPKCRSSNFWISDTATRLPDQSADPTRKEKSAPTEQETTFRKISIVDLGLFQRLTA
jgi:hypothetical protein